MAHGWIKADGNSPLATSLLDALVPTSYDELVSVGGPLVLGAFDLSSIPQRTAVDLDVRAVARLIDAERRGQGVLYIGAPTRNLIVPGIEVVDRGTFGVLRFVAGAGPSIR